MKSDDVGRKKALTKTGAQNPAAFAHGYIHHRGKVKNPMHFLPRCGSSI
ncbi:MAG: hypothetical protein OXP12_06140 [Thaumarchaeota archaeon]|nr:hypothetical protein [Nitrososphaerota archaeon]MDE0526864.1 hypothetical protein [Nitrososphaerota archaeon]